MAKSLNKEPNLELSEQFVEKMQETLEKNGVVADEVLEAVRAEEEALKEAYTPTKVYVQVKPKHIEQVVNFCKKPGEIRVFHSIDGKDYPFRRKLTLWISRGFVQRRPGRGRGRQQKVVVSDQQRILNVSDPFIRSADSPEFEEMVHQFGEVKNFFETLVNEAVKARPADHSVMSDEEREEHLQSYKKAEDANETDQ